MVMDTVNNYGHSVHNCSRCSSAKYHNYGHADADAVTVSIIEFLCLNGYNCGHTYFFIKSVKYAENKNMAM